MASTLQEDRQAIREAVRSLCRDFPDTYWREIDKKERYPQEFVDALTASGYLAVLIPEEYGGAGLGITEASIILEEINRSGGNPGACHAQMYTMGTVLRHGSEEQKRRYLPAIAKGELRLQAFAVTEPNAGSETTRIETRAVRKGDRYIVNGQKIFISRAQQSDLMLLLARTTPYNEVQDKTQGISVFIVDMRNVKGKLEIRPLDMMINHHTNTLFFEDLEIPAENLIGEEGKGFRYIIDGWNAERILIAAEAIGDGRWFVDRASSYARERVVFGRPIGANQGVQFPIAQAYAHVEAADLMRFDAAAKFDRNEKCGAEANMAKLLASEASWEAANVCLTTYGGYGLARDYDVERKFRETRLFTVAPVNNNLVLAFLGQNVLKMPKSY
jgi:acyl-CoA dehydrogenase